MLGLPAARARCSCPSLPPGSRGVRQPRPRGAWQPIEIAPCRPLPLHHRWFCTVVYQVGALVPAEGWARVGMPQGSRGTLPILLPLIPKDLQKDLALSSQPSGRVRMVW